MKKTILLLLLTFTSLMAESLNIKAVVVSPVAELLGQPHRYAPKKGLSLEDYYQDIPFSGEGNSCWRIHQLLFNEIVTVIEERGPEVKVKISNFYYVKQNNSSFQDTYWMLKKNLRYLNAKQQKAPDSSKFPPPISYKSKRLVPNKEQNVVTLKKPFYDLTTNTTYSAGTRFLALPNQNFEGSFGKGKFRVYVYDPQKNQTCQTKIPKNHCIRNYFQKPQHQIQNFVQVLKSWSSQKEGHIPYVLGGFSWTTNVDEKHYSARHDKVTDKTSYHRKGWKQAPKEGFDCVGIIGRAAQICEIPFFCKNTLTLSKHLDPLKKGDSIREGDLIVYPGHVMVITDLKNNLITQARGYENDSGKVAEIPISEIFQDVQTLRDLEEFYQEKRPISILDIRGNVIMVTKRVKILKLRSVWNNL